MKSYENALFTQNQIEQMLFNIACRNNFFQVKNCRAYRRQFKNEKAMKVLSCFLVFWKISRTTLFKFVQILGIKELNAMILNKSG